MDYNNYNYTPEPAAVNGAVLLGVLLLSLLFIVISYAIVAFLTGRIFKKADVPQWIAWAPVYNSWKLLQLGDQQGFWAVLAFVPFLNIVSLIFIYIAMYRIGLKLGKEEWFVLLAIFLPIIWMIWLAFDDSKWQGERAIAATAPTSLKKTTKQTAAKKPTSTKK